MCLPRENCLYTVGSQVTLKCLKSDGGIAFQWFINGTSADFSQTNVRQETLDDVSYLYISNVTNEWNNTTFRCDILSALRIAESNSVTITVRGMPQITISLYIYLYEL